MELKLTECEIKTIQRKLLGIFSEVKKILEKHHLRYFAIDGTCLGAVRHKGFIPWDDDMDIAMPEKDYEEFLRIAPDELPPHLRLCTPDSSTRYTLNFSKVHDAETTRIGVDSIQYPSEYRGICLDIVPLCGVPSKRWLYLKKLELLIVCNTYSRCEMSNVQGIKKIVNAILWRAGKVLESGFFYRRWYRYVSKFGFDKSEYTGCVWSRGIYTDEGHWIYPIDWFSDYVEIPFENTTIRCPVGWHKFLTQVYGNYMELPPKEDRITNHHIAVLDLNRPYSYYVDLAKRGELDL